MTDVKGQRTLTNNQNALRLQLPSDINKIPGQRKDIRLAETERLSGHMGHMTSEGSRRRVLSKRTVILTALQREFHTYDNL